MNRHDLALARQAARALVTGRMRLLADRIPYDFEGVPWAKLANALRVEASARFKPSRPWGWPTHLMVEPSSHCNLSCALCPVTVGLERPQGQMELALFRRVIDEIGPYLFTLLLWDWGEPFVNPAIYEMIAHARGKGVKTISSTNGHLFARQHNADRVIESGLDTLIFAVDGVTQETYERYRRDGELAAALEGIRNVVARKRALGSSRPLVNLRFIVMRHNEHELPRLHDLARELGVDALTLKTLNPCSQDPYDTPEEARKNDAYMPRDRRFRRFQGESLAARVRRRHNPCKHPWYHPSVHWNGVVCSCTYDPHERHPLGDLREQSFAAIWSGEPYRRLRRQFRRNWSEIPLCRNCSYAYVGGDCTHETIAEAVFFPAGAPAGRR